MNDPRLRKLANILVNYSVGVKEGDLVRIAGGEVSSPLIVALFHEVLGAGGHPIVRMVPDECEEIRLRVGSEAQLSFVDPLALHEVDRIDCSIGIWADVNTKALTNVDPTRQAIATQARKSYVAKFLKRAAAGSLRWVGVEFPTQASAQDADMSLSEFEDFVFRAGFLHCPDPSAEWTKVHRQQSRMCRVLDKAEELHFKTPHGTDLVVNVKGRKWINCDGKLNFPDGEVFTGPVENSTEGTLVLTFPAVYGGREVHGVRLKFREGRVVEASADRGEDFLHKMLAQDSGASILGEVALGTNYNVTRFMRNLTFDEKIGGTFHVALGSSYPESGGKNKSGLHWDLVCDLRQGGVVEMDGKPISKNGRFLNKTWPQPE